MVIQIVSLNVRGLRDPVKRRIIFNYYRSRGNVICLQETHSSLKDECIWEAEWGGRIIFSHGTNSSRGVCIMFKKDIGYRIVNTQSDTSGRNLLCELENIDDPQKRLVVSNIYAPNQD